MSGQDLREGYCVPFADLKCTTERVEDKIERVEGRI